MYSSEKIAAIKKANAFPGIDIDKCNGNQVNRLFQIFTESQKGNSQSDADKDFINEVKEDKRQQKVISMVDQNYRATSNQYENPVKDGDKQRLLLGLFQGDRINTLVKRKLRIPVEMIIRKDHGEDFAANNWAGIAQLIINVHLKITYPDTYRDAAKDSQVTDIKKRYPLQLQMLEGVTKFINEGKTIKQIQSLLGV